MGDGNGTFSCLDCIWNEQCASDEICDFFDRGVELFLIADEEVELRIENDRIQFARDYLEYISEFGDEDID